jgi:hypothetical protein
MRVGHGKNHFIIALNPLESRILLRVFQALAQEYRLKPGEVDPKVAAAWYSTQGCVTAKMTDDEIYEWVGHLQSLKSATLDRLEEWGKQLSGMELTEYPLHLRAEDVDSFLTVLNDYRLMMASRHDIGQAELSLPSVAEWLALAPERRAALFEIDFLGMIMEETLRETAGQG